MPLESLLALAAKEGTFWMPPAASTVAEQVDHIYYVIYYLSLIFGIPIIVLMCYFAFKYRRKGTEPSRTHPLEGNVRLEIVWSVIPGALLMLIFAMGFQGYMNMSVAPTNSMDINVRAQTWIWEFEYPGLAGSSPHLVVPVNRPVKLTMVSKDVLHSLYIPAFRVKQDVLPSRYTTLWFEAIEEGEFSLFCTEYCGKGHSLMTTPVHMVKVLSQEAFDLWVKKGGPEGEMMESLTLPKGDPRRKNPWELGEVLFQSKGCVQCHSVGNREPKQGPNPDKIFTRYTPDSVPGNHKDSPNPLLSYFKESLEYPGNYIATGGNGGQMPTFKGQLDDQKVQFLYLYLSCEAGQAKDFEGKPLNCVRGRDEK